VISYVLTICFLFVAGIFLNRCRLLTKSGTVAIVFVGSAVSFGLGTVWLVIITALFFVALVATRLHASRTGGFKPQSCRDAIDLLPVGSAVSIAALQADASAGRLVALAAMAFALSDILASELGPLTSRGAFLVPSFRRVPHGAPGAVSLTGLGFSAVGSVLPSAVTLVWAGAALAAIVFVSGLAGSVVDTLLSAAWRGKFRRRNDVINGCAVGVSVSLVLLLYRFLRVRGLHGL